MTTLHVRKSIARQPLRLAFFLIPLALACFALSPQARARCPESFCLMGNNTVLGEEVLVLNTTGSNNTAIGQFALEFNTTGGRNTAIGRGALRGGDRLSTAGNDNTATGQGALSSIFTGHGNTGNGVEALVFNFNGSLNTANGFDALRDNGGVNNTATGASALVRNGDGDYNTANGYRALAANVTGTRNTANGVDSLSKETTGHNNTGEGFQALLNDTTGRANIALGAPAGSNLTTGFHNIDIGNVGVAGEANKIRIGTEGTQNGTFIAGIYNQTIGNGIPVRIAETHCTNRGCVSRLGVSASSRRFKDDIKPMDKASEAILALKPVTFRYKKEIDPGGTSQFGLVAEEVEKVNSDLVVRDKEGKPYSVRYDQVKAMLLNEFLKEHRKVEQQETTIAQLKSTVTKQEATATEHQKEIEDLTTSLKEQAFQIQQVSAQLAAASPSDGGLEASKPAPQVVNNP